ncbi:MAG: hypothetical protein ABJH98_11995 [Reichenbachiella sp.]|uniref:hypothetical protein n=1 Tax=Reichenbachiella sp. TaxID=2184521 RepID=UPI003296A4B8
MSKQHHLLIILYLTSHLCFSQDKYAKDVNSEDAIIEALYETISGPKGERRDWERLRYLLTPDAKLIPTRPASETKRVPCYLTLDDFITQGDQWLIENGFFEEEIARKTESFGLITHVWSTYQSKWTPEGEPFARGINSIQLMNDGDRWWIVNLYWAAETDDNPLPKKYLK